MPMVVMSGVTLPEQVRAAKYRAVGAGQPVAPVPSDQRRLRRVGLTHADAAALADAQAARHRALDRDLAFEPAIGRDFRDPLHRGFGATAADDGRCTGRLAAMMVTVVALQ